MATARTGEDFDQWFLKTGGDPWDYSSRFFTDRLSRSLAFVRGRLGRAFKGRFIEFGAFDGSFTRPLSVVFPQANIIANDISQFAVEKLSKAVAGCKNVVVIPGDMLTFPKSFPDNDPAGTVVLLLECLYYLRTSEQEELLSVLKNDYRPVTLFISAPMEGGNYYDEKSFTSLIARTGYRIVACHVVTYKRVPPFSSLFNFVLNRSATLRKRYAGQIIYHIESQP